MKEIPEYIFVFENKIGGVAYLNKNIINNTSLRKDVFVKVILVEDQDAELTLFPDKIHADEIIHFKFSFKENRYAVLKRFHRLLGTKNGLIVCNDGLEMESIYLFGTNKTVFQYIHDFYNIGLAVKYGAITDVYLTHTMLFRNVMQSSDPAVVHSFQLNHGVTIMDLEKDKIAPEQLRIVFTGRLVEGKGVQDLFLIDSVLRKHNIGVKWTIIGRGPLNDFLHRQWKENTNICFFSPDTNEEVLSIMTKHDIFLLPTRFEGSPVTILEALSCGLVPVVSDLPGGIDEVVTPDIGRKIPLGKIDLFAEAIIYFNKNRQVLHQLSINCRKMAEKEFDIRNTSNRYFSLLGEYMKFKKKPPRLAPLRIGFRLDKKWLPNFFVVFLRSIRKT